MSAPSGGLGRGRSGWKGNCQMTGLRADRASNDGRTFRLDAAGRVHRPRPRPAFPPTGAVVAVAPRLRAAARCASGASAVRRSRRGPQFPVASGCSSSSFFRRPSEYRTAAKLPSVEHVMPRRSHQKSAGPAGSRNTTTDLPVGTPAFARLRRATAGQASSRSESPSGEGCPAVAAPPRRRTFNSPHIPRSVGWTSQRSLQFLRSFSPPDDVAVAVTCGCRRCSGADPTWPARRMTCTAREYAPASSLRLCAAERKPARAALRRPDLRRVATTDRPQLRRFETHHGRSAMGHARRDRVQQGIERDPLRAVPQVGLRPRLREAPLCLTALWLGMQQAFDVWHAEQALAADLERIPGHAA